MSDKQKFEDLIVQLDQLNSDYCLADGYHDMAQVANHAIAIIDIIKVMYEHGKIKF